MLNIIPTAEVYGNYTHSGNNEAAFCVCTMLNFVCAHHHNSILEKMLVCMNHSILCKNINAGAISDF